MAGKFQQDVDEILKCSICLEQIKQPKMLNCQHSFCFKPCLENMAKSSKDSHSVKCPECRGEHFYTVLSDIPDNLHLKKLLEAREDLSKKTSNDGMYITAWLQKKNNNSRCILGTK